MTGERYVDDHTASEYSENAEERELGERMDFGGLLDHTAPLDKRFADGEYLRRGIQRLTYGNGGLHCFVFRKQGSGKCDLSIDSLMIHSDISSIKKSFAFRIRGGYNRVEMVSAGVLGPSSHVCLVRCFVHIADGHFSRKDDLRTPKYVGSIL